MYKIKIHADESVEQHKAHFIAKRFTQEYGINYEKTFAPITRLTSIRILLVVATL